MARHVNLCRCLAKFYSLPILKHVLHEIECYNICLYTWCRTLQIGHSFKWVLKLILVEYSTHETDPYDLRAV